MSASYKSVNYTLRPAKTIERKMLVEAIQRLSVFGQVSSYRYVGFGSIYYADFKLFHRQTGIHNMLSIEKNTNEAVRFEFNKPFRCIKIKFGHSDAILPTLPWNVKTILWLDYDGSLNKNCLSDIATFCAKCPAGSVLIVTINASFDKTSGDFFDRFVDAIGKENLPFEITKKDMQGDGAAKVIRTVIINNIAKTLNGRNGILTKQNKINFKQLFNFVYADGARMVTVGGLLWKNSQADIIKHDPWLGLHYIREDEEQYVINAPHLTLREVQYLESHLPIGASRNIKNDPIPESERNQYEKIYRYYPTFTEF